MVPVREKTANELWYVYRDEVLTKQLKNGRFYGLANFDSLNTCIRFVWRGFIGALDCINHDLLTDERWFEEDQVCFRIFGFREFENLNSLYLHVQCSAIIIRILHLKLYILFFRIWPVASDYLLAKSLNFQFHGKSTGTFKYVLMYNSTLLGICILLV